MTHRKKMKEAAYTIVFMVIMTVVCVGAVSVIYQHSKGRIELNQEMFISPYAPKIIATWCTSLKNC